jgi:hypothetical protein
MLQLRPVQGNVNTVLQSSDAALAGVGAAIDAMEIERVNDGWLDDGPRVLSRSGR